MDKRKIWAVTALILWVAGLAMTLIGLNLKNGAGAWMTAVGSPVFLIGLAIAGVLWFKKNR